MAILTPLSTNNLEPTTIIIKPKTNKTPTFRFSCLLDFILSQELDCILLGELILFLPDTLFIFEYIKTISNTININPSPRLILPLAPKTIKVNTDINKIIDLEENIFLSTLNGLIITTKPKINPVLHIMEPTAFPKLIVV